MKLSSTPIIKYTKQIATEMPPRYTCTAPPKQAVKNIEKQLFGTSTIEDPTIIPKNVKSSATKYIEKIKTEYNSIIQTTKKALNNYVGRLNYTYQHKKAFLQVEKQLLGKNTLSGYLHDADKLVMYAFGLSKDAVRVIHRRMSPHHEYNGKIKNPVAAVIDWTCASLTKTDKQIPAREHYEQTYSHVKGVKEVLDRFGL
jgi:hypothetical protein